MRKVISFSALVSGLLAAQGLAPAAGVVRRGDDGAMVAPEVGLSAEAQARLEAEVVEMIEKGPVDVGGMKELHGKMVGAMREHLEGKLLAQAGRTEGIVGDFPHRDGELWSGGRVPVLPIQARGIEKMEKAAFLGVTAMRAGEAVRHQVGLPKGMGLVVDFVAKDSPAEAAGLQQHDVLSKLDDQWLVNLEQLAVLVRAKKGGDAVELTLFRGGKELKVSAKLVEKEVPAIEEGMRFEMERPGRKTVEIVPRGAIEFLPRTDGRRDWQQAARTTVVANAEGGTTGTLVDEQHVITLTRDKDGKATVVVKEKTGREIFVGPYTTEEDKAKVPAELKAKVEKVANHKGAAMDAGKNAAKADVVVINRVDDDHDISLRIEKGVRSVVVKEVKTGKVIYEGTGSGEEELKKMPVGVAEKVKAIEAKVGGEK
jgi:hypothetical protein